MLYGAYRVYELSEKVYTEITLTKLTNKLKGEGTEGEGCCITTL